MEVWEVQIGSLGAEPVEGLAILCEITLGSVSHVRVRVFVRRLILGAFRDPPKIHVFGKPRPKRETFPLDHDAPWLARRAF